MVRQHQLGVVRSAEKHVFVVHHVMFKNLCDIYLMAITCLTDVHMVNVKVLMGSQKMVKGPSGPKCGLIGFNAV